MVTQNAALPFGRVFDRLVRDFGFSDDEFAMALGTTTRMVERWHQGVLPPSRPAIDRLKRLEYLRRRLYTVMQQPDALSWLRQPNEQLGWVSPNAAVIAGDFRNVNNAVDLLAARPPR